MYVDDEYVAVIDGAGDALGRRWRGVSHGVHAAEAVRRGLAATGKPQSPRMLVDSVTSELARLRKQLAVDGLGAPWPAASFAVYSNTLRAVVRVGDCSLKIDAIIHEAPMKSFERLLVEVRSFIIGQALRADLEVSSAEDHVRAVFGPLYKYQESCQNEAVRGPYSFAVLDGSPVPDWGIEVFEIPSGVVEICLLSDGYVIPGGTLEEAEAALARVLRDDPMLVGRYAQSKQPSGADGSFDDRSFVRFLTR